MNEKFYTNGCWALPLCYTVNEIHQHWNELSPIFFDYRTGILEWLFPVNRASTCVFIEGSLTVEDAIRMAKSKLISTRFVRSYELVLGNFGIELVSKSDGLLRVTDQFVYNRILSGEGHCSIENLRYIIVRVTLSLGLLGFRRYRNRFLQLLKTGLKRRDIIADIDSDLQHSQLLDIDSVFLLGQAAGRCLITPRCYCKRVARKYKVRSKDSRHYGREYYCCAQRPRCKYFCFQS